MNKNYFRLIFSRVRGMLVAVEETAGASGKSGTGEAPGRVMRGGQRASARRGLRVSVFGASIAAGIVPMAAHAQIVGAGAQAPSVIQTPNGLPQVNINRPSGAGVSVNTYQQFDVRKPGAILNNSPAIVQTQQGGLIDGNPNFGPGQSARVIVNQVNSAAASQLNGYLEVAGRRAEVVIANGSGIAVNGGGFINTSRATLVSGTPTFGADGALAGFNVTGGTIAVRGAGLNASNVDQVDLLARAVQVNAALHAKRLNVVTGANAIDRDAASATAIRGEDAAPEVAVDVSALGGMYADAIRLVGTEHGVGVNHAGVLAAQAGDLTLTTGGTLVLAGETKASGNLNVTAKDGIENSGTTYAQQGANFVTTGALRNGGVLAAQRNTTIRAGSVSASGTLGAGVNNDGSMTSGSGDLSVTADGVVSATGQNVAGGNASIHGERVDLSGSRTGAGGDVTLLASAGDLDLRGASASASRTLTANAAGALRGDDGALSSGGAMQLTAASVSNARGQIVSGATLDVSATGALDNTAGTIQAAGRTNLHGGALDNRAGRIVSLNDEGLSITADDALTHASGTTASGDAGGVIAGNGDVSVQAGTLRNGGEIAAQGNAQVGASAALDNSGGTLSGTSVEVSTAALTNAGGAIRGDRVTVDAAQLDNRHGQIAANRLALHATHLSNAGGTATQFGTEAMTVDVSGTLNNAGGTLQTNATDLTLAPAELVNDGGALTHAGTGTLTIAPGQGEAAFSNVGGKLTSNGSIALGAGQIDNTSGRISTAADLAIHAATLTGGGAYQAGNDLSVALQGDFTNDARYRFDAGRDLAFTLPGTFTNAGFATSTRNLSVDAGNIVNDGTLAAGELLRTQSATLTNRGTLVGGSVSLGASSLLENVGPSALIGATDAAATLELLAPVIENRDDTTDTDTPPLTAIYGLGGVVLAGGKDASGQYLNARRILNQSGLIQSDGDMAMHADLVTNTRRQLTTEWVALVDPDRLAQYGISLSGRTGQIGVSDPDSIGGAYIDPPHGGQYNSTYQFTTYTGKAYINQIATISPQGQIVAGGNLDLSSVGVFRNVWGSVSAAGDIAMPGTLDQTSWQGQLAPQIRVVYSGHYHYRNYDGSVPDWTYSFCESGCNTSADIRHFALQPDYESSWHAGGTIGGSGTSIENPAGNAGLPQLPGPVTGGVQVDPVIGHATAQDVLNNLSLPKGGLFKPSASPDAPYLIETNPAFTERRNFLSSDYFLQMLGLNPQETEKRLGDGYYEQWLVRNQITLLTGQAVLGPYADLQAMYGALLEAGASLSKTLNLSLGMGLSADQVAQLTSNVVLMETRVVDGQSVLVPVVYLAPGSQGMKGSGPLISATNIDIENAKQFTNSGTMTATDKLSISGQQIDNAYGTLKSGGPMALAAQGNIDLTSAKVQAGSLGLVAGGDLLLDTAAKTQTQINDNGATRVTTTLGPTAQIDVAGDAAIATGGNFEQRAGNLNVGGNLAAQIGGDWTLDTQQSGEHKVVNRANGVSDTDFVKDTGSSVKVGGQSLIAVGNDLTAKGAQLDLAGGGTIVAGGNVTLGTSTATSTVNSNSAGDEGNRSYAESLHRSDQQLTGTTLTSGDNLTLVAGKDLNVIGSAIKLDKGTAALAAGGDVNIASAAETHALKTDETHSRSGVVSGTKIASGTDQTMTLNQGSLISADQVSIASGRDINVTGSTIVGTNDVALNAARDLTITTSQDTFESSDYYQKKETGLMAGGGLSVSVGSSSLKTTSQTSEVSNNGSLIGSLNGNVSLTAGNDLHVTGSDLIAGQNISGTGANVTIDAARDTSHLSQTQEISKSGLTLALKAPVIDAVSNVVDQARAAASSQDGRAAALHGMAAASGALDAAGAGAQAAGMLAAGATPEFKVELSLGSSQSKSAFSEDSVTHRGSNISAGGTAAFAATGTDTPGSGNVTIAGSNVNAQDVILAAKNQVNVVNTTDTDSTRSTNELKSASVGISVGTGGVGVSAAMSKANGDGNSDLATQNNSHVNAANGVTIISGGDTNLTGANVSGNQVNVDVGGNLNIASVQDTLSSAAHQSSKGGGFSISQGGGSANYSQSKGNASGNYAGVNEQAGIQAGDGGFNVNVKGNTDLTGAFIASDADASKNTLTTGSLSFSDVQNHSHYEAKSSGFSAGASTGNGGNNMATRGNTSGKNTGGVTPMLGQSESGDESALTRSGVSEGAIAITDTSSQKQDVASLNRDTTDLNGQVARTPDLQNLLSNQADMMAAASAAGEAVSRRIGDYADKKMKEAKENGDEAGADAWKEGGANRALMQGAGAALVTGLAGGNAIGGAAGAAIASIAAGKLNELSGAIASADPTGDSDMNQALGNIVANALATGAGAVVGGNAGAVAGSNVDRFNRQDHEKADSLTANKDFVAQVCPAGAQCSDAVLQTAIQAQLANADSAATTIQPNYATVNGSMLSINGTFSVNLYDGQRYVGGGVSMTNPSATSWMPSGTVTLGWIFGASDAKTTNSYLNGDGSQYFVSVPMPFGISAFAAISHAYGGSTAIEIGLGSPGGKSIGVMPWGHSVPVNKNNGG